MILFEKSKLYESKLMLIVVDKKFPKLKFL